MSRLKASWELKIEILDLDMAPKLRDAVNEYIEQNDNAYVGREMRISNVIYRQHLHYIIDNINNPKLITEIQKLNVK